VRTLSAGVSAVLAAALLGAGACGAAILDPDAIFATSETDLKLCFASSLSISPDGRSLAVIARHDVGDGELKSTFRSGDIAFADLDCAASGAHNCRTTRFSSLSAVTGPLWGAPGEAFIFSGGQKVIQVRLATGAASPPGRMAFASAFEVQALGGLAFSSADEAARSIDALYKRAADQAPGERVKALTITAPGSAFSIAMDPIALSQRGFWDGGGAAAATYPAAPDVWLVRSGPDKAALVGIGRLQDLAGKTVGPNQAAPWAAPFYDSGKGELAGTFMVRDIRHSGGEALDRLSTWLSSRTTYAVVSLTYSSARDVAAALVRSTDGQVGLAVSAGGKIETALSNCDETAGQAGGGADIGFRDLGDHDWSLPSVQYRHRGAAKGVVYYFHGGPGTRSGPFGYWHVVNNYLKRGLDVVVIDPSGSSGAGDGVAARIAAQGADAIERDAGLVAAAMRQDRAAAKPVILHAESFGAVFALSPAITGFGPDASLLVVPWLSSDATLQRSPPTKPQRASEALMLGERSGGFFAWHRKALEAWAPPPRTHVIFAAKDPLSQPADIPASAAPHLKVTELAKTSHARIYGHPGAWTAIDAALTAADAPRGR